MKMTQISVLSNKYDERFFSNIGKAVLERLHNNATDNVSKWISSYLERYFLSSYFNDPDSLERVYNEKIPEQFRGSEKPVYAVHISQNVYNKWMLIIEFLNSLSTKIKWDVPTAILKYEQYIHNLANKEQIHDVFDCKHDGYKWVQLQDQNALRRESGVMQHCTSRNDTPHLEDLLSKRYIFLSLRKNNNPHVTLKYNPRSNVITDLVGKQNRPPKEEYYPYILQIMNYLHLVPQNEHAAPFNKFKVVNNEWVLK